MRRASHQNCHSFTVDVEKENLSHTCLGVTYSFPIIMKS